MELTKDILLTIINEQNSPILKTTGNKPIVDAIKNRKKITFYYSGPRKPKKDSVKSGYRVKAEPVALGLSKKGKLMVRAWVDTPSVTKTGFGKGHWRTFLLSRTNNVQITDEVFNEKRPGYNDNNDGSMTVVYAKTNWNTPIKSKKEVEPKTVKVDKPVEPTTPVTPKEPEKEVPKTQELPQPKPEVKPEPTQQDDVDKKKELYDKKKSEWVNKQKEVGGNTKPGQGTRERFKKEVEKELPQPKPDVKPEEKPDESPENETDNQLQESIKRIKSLMFL
jgi:hypothetical protein